MLFAGRPAHRTTSGYWLVDSRRRRCSSTRSSALNAAGYRAQSRANCPASAADQAPMTVGRARSRGFTHVRHRHDRRRPRPARGRAAGRAGVRGRRPPPAARPRAGRDQRRYARRRYAGSCSPTASSAASSAAVVGVVGGVAVAFAVRGPARGAPLAHARFGGYRVYPRWLARHRRRSPSSPACSARSCRRSPPVARRSCSPLAGRRGITRSRVRLAAPRHRRLIADRRASRPRPAPTGTAANIVLAGLIVGELGMVLCTPTIVGGSPGSAGSCRSRRGSRCGTRPDAGPRRHRRSRRSWRRSPAASR